MPLDGLSFSNSGLFRIITPTEIAMQAEQTAQINAEPTVKKLEEKEKLKPDVEKDKENQEQEGRFTEDESEDEDSNGQNNEAQENLKKYKVKFNKLTDMVELVDQKTGRVIETIHPEDLINLIAKTKNASGILVDREV